MEDRYKAGSSVTRPGESPSERLTELAAVGMVRSRQIGYTLKAELTKSADGLEARYGVGGS